jgi:hypothetical protein
LKAGKMAGRKVRAAATIIAAPRAPIREQSFFETTAQLNRRMASDHAAVNEALNPIAVDLGELPTPGLMHVLLQYSLFSRRIVALLLDAFYVMEFQGWAEISAEVMQNITEELGAHGDSVRTPHYVLLRRGYQRALEIDVAWTEPYPATRQFLDSMHSLLGGDDAATVAGAVYALESTATPELVMTYGWTQELFARMGAGMPDEVRVFFTSHIDEIEIEHERRLRDACAAWIDRPGRASRFAAGFESVLIEMDRWWSGLHAEAFAECGG